MSRREESCMSSPNLSTIRIAASDESTTPFLHWNTCVSGSDSMPLACPQCAGPNLHLDTIHIATPTIDHYTPGVGLTINPDTGAATGDDAARLLHAGKNRGPMLSIGYWCENQCRGRIELRAHKGHTYANLHHEPPLPEKDL